LWKINNEGCVKIVDQLLIKYRFDNGNFKSVKDTPEIALNKFINIMQEKHGITFKINGTIETKKSIKEWLNTPIINTPIIITNKDGKLTLNTVKSGD